MGFVQSPIALVVSFSVLGFMLYRRVNLGITLNATALLFAALSLDWQEIPASIYETSVDPITVATVLATFGIMLLSQLYKETKVINDLSESASGLIKNSKVVSSVLPAIIGLLPVAGGALMSAPLVDREAEKLGLKPEKKAYINVWFRHTIFPVYPLGQVLIITAALTGVALPLIILRQIPVVIAMVATGYVVAFWKVTKKQSKQGFHNDASANSNLRRFFIAFSPILATIAFVIGLNVAGLGLGNAGFDVFLATIVGLVVLMLISKPGLPILARPLKSKEIYSITLAAYGAFLLRNVIVTAGISELFKSVVANGTVDVVLMLAFIPAILGFATGSPSGGVAISVSILAGMLTFSPRTAALLFMSAYLGYLIVPSHLCFAFTVDYFKCSIGKVYKYVVPSFLLAFTAALLVYFLI